MRTLQCGLAQSGLSYSRLIQEARFEAAVYLLGDPDMKIIDVAYATGYEDPSNFARAFRQLAGVSPQEYRMQPDSPECAPVSTRFPDDSPPGQVSVTLDYRSSLFKLQVKTRPEQTVVLDNAENIRQELFLIYLASLCNNWSGASPLLIR